MDGAEDQAQSSTRAGDGAELVHGPGERHAAVPADAAERRPQPGGAAAACTARRCCPASRCRWRSRPARPPRPTPSRPTSRSSLLAGSTGCGSCRRTTGRPWASAPSVSLATSTAPASSSSRATVALVSIDWSLNGSGPPGRRVAGVGDQVLAPPRGCRAAGRGTCRRRSRGPPLRPASRASSSVSVTTHCRAGSYFLSRSR